MTTESPQSTRAQGPEARARSSRRSQARDAVVEVFATHRGFASAAEVHEAASRDRPRLSRATVYRAIRLLQEDGLLDMVVDARGRTTYRQCGRRDRHSHLTCRGCGVVVELDPPELDPLESAAEQAGCRDVSASVVVRGFCPACSTGARAAGRGDEG